MKRFLAALLFAAAIPAAPGAAQVTTELTQAISGTRLDVNATGEVTRVPDIAMISAGVVTRSTCSEQAVARVTVSESGGYAPPPPPMPAAEMAVMARAPDTRIEPGEQMLQVNLSMVFELQ